MIQVRIACHQEIYNNRVQPVLKFNINRTSKKPGTKEFPEPMVRLYHLKHSTRTIQRFILDGLDYIRIASYLYTHFPFRTDFTLR
jgi:hypothetical protein